MPSRPDKLEQCFDAGVDARQRGRSRADNPYAVDTDEHREWAAGWAATLDLDEDRDPASTRIDVADDDESDAPVGAVDRTVRDRPGR